MSLRDLAVFFAMIGLVPVSLRRPWIGILGWYWIAYMVPHGLTWGFAKTLPIAMVVGGATLVGFVLCKDRKPLPRTWTTFFMLACTVHFTLTTILAHNPDLAWDKWDRVSKILLMTFVTMCLFQDRVRLRWLYLVPALSLGFYGVKGALWVLRTGGGGSAMNKDGAFVLGPEMGFFADNNTLGLALCMALPLLLYLAREEERRWLKRILQLTFALSIIAIPFTYSRGAFLGLAIVIVVLIWRSPWRMRFATAILLTVLIGAPLAPERLWERIGSITKQDTAETRDNSTAMRLAAWEASWNIAVKNPLTGVGFRALWNHDIWFLYYGDHPFGLPDSHSLYFEVLSEHGLLGFALYLGALISSLLTLRRLRRRWHNDPQHGYISRYAEMTQLSLYPFLVAGAFIGVAYFDLYFLLLGTTTMLYSLSRAAETAPVPVAMEPRPSSLVVRPNPIPSPSRRRPRHA